MPAGGVLITLVMAGVVTGNVIAVLGPLIISTVLATGRMLAILIWFVIFVADHM